jgi:hypothetical protein
MNGFNPIRIIKQKEYERGKEAKLQDDRRQKDNQAARQTKIKRQNFLNTGLTSQKSKK